MKLYVVVDNLFSGKIIAICTDESRAQEIGMRMQDEGQSVKIFAYEDGRVKPNTYCFNLSGELEGLIYNEKKEQGISYNDGKPDCVVVVAKTEAEAKPKMRELLTAYYQKKIDELKEADCNEPEGL